ncbi:MAG: YkgJ family cysteine cluster protein [Candidatus Gastranaerophilaceae bacterium]|jgi:Fe-S-cluster containining protein
MTDAVKKVEELLKLPQELCKKCGKCCKVAIFKGGLKNEDVIKLSNSTTADISQVIGAVDFLTIFKPYETIEEAKKINTEFVERILKNLNKNEDEIDFFYCKFVGDNNSCKIHQNRPSLCKTYPSPSEFTHYFEGCGFKEKGIENWQKIVTIIKEIEQKQRNEGAEKF